MRYYLMNKNNKITSFEIDTSYSPDYEVINVSKFDRNKMPIGHHLREDDYPIERSLSAWISSRDASFHNSLSAGIIFRLKLYNHDKFIRVTHMASLNDTFWVKAEDEDITFEDISLYSHSYDEQISKMSLGTKNGFDGIEPIDPLEIRYMPELLHRGSFPRMFEKTEEGIMFYKKSGAVRNAYSEIMSSEISEVINGRFHIPYELDTKYGETVSKCRLFTDENTGLVTPYALLNGIYPTSDMIFDLFKDLGYEDEYRKMMVFDAIIFNTDRHLNNFGCLIDNNTLELKGFAPFFDTNLSLFGGLGKEDFNHPDRHIYYRKPRFENDFTEMGKRYITDDIKEDISKLLDFSFKFRGNKECPEYIVEGTEKIIKMQVKALLEDISSDKAFTIEPTEDEKIKDKYAKAVFRAKALDRLFIKNNAYYSSEIITDPIKYTVIMTIRDKNGFGEMVIDMMGLNITQSGKQFDLSFQDTIMSRISLYKTKE